VSERTHHAQNQLEGRAQGSAPNARNDHCRRICYGSWSNLGHCGQLSFRAEAASASALKTLQYYR